MKVILNEKVEGLGNAGEIKVVKDGYARNYLLPKKLAMEANEQNIKALENIKIQENKKKERLRNRALNLKKRLEKTKLTIARQQGEGNKLYGSVNTSDIAEALLAHDIKISKNQIMLSEPIKATGIYNLRVKLYDDIEGKLQVWVVADT